MANVALILDRALKLNGIPIIGVFIGDENDRTTWRAAYDITATQTHKDQAATIISNLVIDDALEKQREAQTQVDELPIFFKAVVLVMLDQINTLRAGASLAQITPSQLMTAIKNKAATL